MYKSIICICKRKYQFNNHRFMTHNGEIPGQIFVERIRAFAWFSLLLEPLHKTFAKELTATLHYIAVLQCLVCFITAA